MKRRTLSGFTLIEVLVALAIFAALIVALNVFVFSMAEAWGARRDERLFGQHVRAVTRHVDALINTAIRPTDGGSVLTVEDVLRPLAGTASLLVFQHAEPDRVMTGPGAKLPDVKMALEVRTDEGLILDWMSQLESRFGEDAWHSNLLSPFVTGIAYDYYDDSFRTWETLDTLKSGTDGKPLVPVRLRLRFKHGTLSDETVIDIPVVRPGLPSF